MWWTVFEPTAGDRARGGRVGVALRDNVGWLRESGERPPLDAQIKNVLLHLQLRGASFARDLARPAGVDPAGALAALWELFWAGLATPDTFSAIVAAGATPRGSGERGPARGGARGAAGRGRRG